MAESEDRQEQAARWIALRQSGEMTFALQREYRSWLASDERNRAEMTAHEESLAAADAMGADLLAEEFERQLHEEDASHVEQKNRRRVTKAIRWQAMAAGVGALVVVAGGIYASQPLLQQPVVYASNVGQQTSVSLDDGSTATLNTNSELAVKFSRNERGVRIEHGEALFDVAKDASRPFIVQAGIATIEVTGTVFNVRTLPAETSVSVLEGRVRVNASSGPQIELTAGQKLKIDAHGLIRSMAFDPQAELAWQNGRAHYEEEALQNVITDLNRYFETPLVLADASLAEIPVTGEFDVTDQEAAVASLVAAFELQSVKDGRRILLSGDTP